MSFSPIMYIVACFLFIIFCIIFARPLRAFFKLVVNSAIGAAAMLLFNFVGGIFGAYVGINAFTVITVGLLGIPGFLSLLILQFFLK